MHPFVDRAATGAHVRVYTRIRLMSNMLPPVKMLRPIPCERGLLPPQDEGAHLVVPPAFALGQSNSLPYM